MLAVAAAYPDAIFTGRTAAWLNGWRDVVPEVITAVHGGRSHATGCIRLSHSTLPPETWHERAGLRFMTPAMTAVDLIPSMGAELVDRLLREDRGRGRALPRLVRAMQLTSGRPGNQRRRVIIGRSRTNPWSAGERELHDLLEAAGLTGWSANRRLTIEGHDVIPDVAFDRARLIVEFDGWGVHGQREAFERDRERRNLLVLSGWRVLNVTWRMITSAPEQVITTIRQALAT